VVKRRQPLEAPLRGAPVIILDPHAPAAARVVRIVEARLATEDAPDLEFLVGAHALQADGRRFVHGEAEAVAEAVHIAAGRGVVLANGGVAVGLEQVAHGFVEGIRVFLCVEARLGQGMGLLDQFVSAPDVRRCIAQAPGARDVAVIAAGAAREDVEDDGPADRDRDAGRPAAVGHAGIAANREDAVAHLQAQRASPRADEALDVGHGERLAVRRAQHFAGQPMPAQVVARLADQRLGQLAGPADAVHLVGVLGGAGDADHVVLRLGHHLADLGAAERAEQAIRDVHVVGAVERHAALNPQVAEDAAHQRDVRGQAVAAVLLDEGRQVVGRLVDEL